MHCGFCFLDQSKLKNLVSYIGTGFGVKLLKCALLILKINDCIAVQSQVLMFGNYCMAGSRGGQEGSLRYAPQLEFLLKKLRICGLNQT